MGYVKGLKYRWQIPSVDNQKAQDIALAYSLSFAVSHVLVARKFFPSQTLDQYLFGDADLVYDPALLKDATKAVDRILRAIENKEKILICGDYDVDGVTSSALVLMGLLPLGAQINFFLPNRVRDGYGLSTTIIERAAKNGYSVVITVDNGITAFEPAKKAQELGIDLIITDHHKPHAHVPQAFAVVNPQQVDCPYPFKYFAGVGVAFKLLTLLYKKLDTPIPLKVYELLLLGTIADVVPLVEENRWWVRYGLRYIKEHESYSLQVLKKNGKIEKPILSATDIGFCLTPQINALGRLEDARQAVNFLLGTNRGLVDEVGIILAQLNERRKDVERDIITDIQKKITEKSIDVATQNALIVSSRNWPAGVIGLVASRFVGMYGKPTILFHETADGLLKGSCRSIVEFNMFDALASMSDLIIQFGGHSLAAGLSIKKSNFDAFKTRLHEAIAKSVDPSCLIPKIRVDAELLLTEANKKLITDLALLEPFGNSNEQPLFYVKDLSLVESPVLLKELHVKCKLFADGIIKQVIFFNRPELYQWLCDNNQESFVIIATVSQNYWKDSIRIELIGQDIMLQKDFHDYCD
jgi:single-stranded-DNA-specific exonuclease